MADNLKIKTMLVGSCKEMGSLCVLLIVQTKYILIQSHGRFSLLGQHDVSSSQGLRSRCLDTMANIIRHKCFVELLNVSGLKIRNMEEHYPGKQ